MLVELVKPYAKTILNGGSVFDNKDGSVARKGNKKVFWYDARAPLSLRKSLPDSL